MRATFLGASRNKKNTYPFIAERASKKTPNGSGTTEVITLTSAPAAGNTLILFHGARITSVTGISIADSKGNTWTIDAGPLNGSNQLAIIASTRQNTATLASGDTVTITYGTAPTNRMTLIEEFAGLVTSSYVDKTASAASGTATLTPPSGTTAATTQAGDLAVAVFVGSQTAITSDSYNASGTVGTYSAFPTDNVQANGSNAKTMMACYQKLTATGAQTAVINWAPNSAYQSLLVTYKGTW